MRILIVAAGLIVASSAIAEPQGLSEIYDLAVDNDPALRSQLATRDLANALSEQVRGGRGLSADLSISAKQTQNLKIDDDYARGTLSVTLSLPLINSGLDASIESQDAAAREADVTLAAYRQSHIVSVANTYFSVLSAEQDLAASLAEVEAFERQLEQAAERLSVGIGTRVDVDQARARLDLTKVGLISAEVARETANFDLQRLVGAPIVKLADLSEKFVADINRELRKDLNALVDVHPNVVIKFEAYRRALADLDEARAESSPSLALSSIFSVSDASGGNTSSTSTSARSNVLALTWSAPIYTNGVAGAKVKVAQFGVIRSEANLLKARREVLTAMQVAYRNLEASVRLIEARRLAIVSAASRVEATEAAYAVGSGDIVELLNAKKDLFATERDFAKARHRHVIQQLQFDLAIGDLSESSVARIDRNLIQ